MNDELQPSNESKSDDPQQPLAVAALRALFEREKERVFFSRQIEVANEDRWFHWLTNRALRELVSGGEVSGEVRPLRGGGSIHLVWNRKHRYNRRDSKRVIELVEEYADPNIGAAVGLHGELMVLEGFARTEFVMRGRNSNEYRGRKWTESGHDMDFIFERDGVGYGVEVKNTLGYMEYEELKVKMAMCKFLGIKPIFAARMLPRTWIQEIDQAGGFALIMKYQLYPLAHKELARRVRTELGLPVDSPRALEDGTMRRVLNWREGR